MKDSCILYPEVDGKDSRLYRDLLEKNKLSRPLTNYLYAYYTSSDMAEVMDNAGYKRNKQGEHNANDMLNFIEFDKFQDQLNNLNRIEIQIGAADFNGGRINYTDAKEALGKADAFNDSHERFVATVVRHDDNYNIIVYEKNASTFMQSIDVKQRLKAWGVYKQAFNAVGIDIENMPDQFKTMFSAFNTALAQQLKNYRYVRMSEMKARDATILLTISKDNPTIKKAVSEFGSIEEAAQFVEDVNTGIKTPTDRQRKIIVGAIKESLKFNGLNLDALNEQVKQIMQNVQAESPEEPVRVTLHKLNKKYKIGINEIHKTRSDIQTLSDAAIESLFKLKQQLRDIERHQGNLEEGKRVETIIKQLTSEIGRKQYYLGMIRALKEFSANIYAIDGILETMPETGSEIEKIFESAEKLWNVKKIIDEYSDLVNALSDESVKIDESISQLDIDNIRKVSSDLKKYIDKKTKVVNSMAEGVMTSLMTQIVGSNSPDGQAIINAVKLAAKDASIMDFLYSVGRSSNPIIAAMGYIIRNAQNDRNKTLNDISIRIKRATNKLYDSGSDSAFMYEDDTYLISDIDWKLYSSARKAAIRDFKAQGLKGIDFEESLRDWEEENTVDRVVDLTNGRTERIPDERYRKAFPELTGAQREYYDTMMQIKGELGSLLPIYAQRQYLAPQVTRTMFDALGNAKNLKDVAKALGTKIADFVTVREDDTNFGNSVIADGDRYKIVDSDYDMTPLKEIPIFYMTKLENGERLLRNFSTGLQAFAGTAINYDAMNSVVDVVEFMGNYAKGQKSLVGQRKADVVENGTIRVIKDLRDKSANHNTQRIVDSFINQFIYGQYRQKNSFGPWFDKFVDSVIRYTSFKGLATNVKGAVANYIMGEFQMLIEAGASEFYGFKNYAAAHGKLFGNSGVTGEIWDLLTENRNSKSMLFCDLFDPEQENFESKRHQAYHKSMFRKLLAHDLSFIGYGAGEYLIHYVNMYAILDHEKVLINGERKPLYDAFEVTEKEDGVAELRLKDGVTTEEGGEITPEYLEKVKNKIAYVNQTTHGAMNKEDKGLIYQYWWGRMAMNFRQWMVEHYSRRFRGRHFDFTLKESREGYWVSLGKALRNMSEDSKDAAEQGMKLEALKYWMKDFMTLNLRYQVAKDSLTDDQKYNCKRAIWEGLLLIALYGASFALGEPDDHKKEFWRRWWIYQTRRMILDTEASMPHPKMFQSVITIMNSPFGGTQTMSSFLYMFYGLANGDLWNEIQLGDHKGENRYMRNVKKYVFPFFKDWEQMQKMDTDDSVFQPFNITPNGK